MALIGELLPGETPLTEQDVQGLKLPLVKTRAQLNAVEGANILGGKQWALGSRNSRIPKMFTVEYVQELHRRMLGSNPTLSAISFDLFYQALELLAFRAEWPIECQIRPLQAHSRSTRSGSFVRLCS